MQPVTFHYKAVSLRTKIGIKQRSVYPNNLSHGSLYAAHNRIKQIIGLYVHLQQFYLVC